MPACKTVSSYFSLRPSSVLFFFFSRADPLAVCSRGLSGLFTTHGHRSEVRPEVVETRYNTPRTLSAPLDTFPEQGGSRHYRHTPLARRPSATLQLLWFMKANYPLVLLLLPLSLFFCRCCFALFVFFVFFGSHRSLARKWCSTIAFLSNAALWNKPLAR